ncbi:MAG: LacI family transcriptional regulator [Clostridiales bacterium]|nr:LacI family transcriptional regulator [Clostridiales bacterium]
MKVKMADVARYLGVSKATVSLAVNGKPGVNEQTRQKILDCIRQMEENGGNVPGQPKEGQSAVPNGWLTQMIKILVIDHQKQVVCDPELDLWPGVLSTFDAEARKLGYLCGITYLNGPEEETRKIIAECNLSLVAGVIFFGAEMEEADLQIAQQIHKPIVIYDYDPPNGAYSSVCVDNSRAVDLAFDLLHRSGAKKIRYLATSKQIYNFEQRRGAFRYAMLRQGQTPQESDLVPLGSTIAEIASQTETYLQTHELPDAFLMENYQVSMGFLTAAQRLGLKLPGQVKLVGIDEIPSFFMPDAGLVQIRIPHKERAIITMSLLDNEIKGIWQPKTRVMTRPTLLEGKTV